MIEHLVGPNQDIRQIADEYNLPIRKLLDANPQLSNEGRNACLLIPGEVLKIPQAEERMEEGETEKTHEFRLERDRFVLRYQLLKSDGSPWSKVAFSLWMEGSEKVVEGKTDEKGRLEVTLNPSSRRARLTAYLKEEGEGEEASAEPEGEEIVRDLIIGGLDPIRIPDSEEPWILGIQQRLSGLGYHHGELNGEADEETSAAVSRFCGDYSLGNLRYTDARFQDHLRTVFDSYSASKEIRRSAPPAPPDLNSEAFLVTEDEPEAFPERNDLGGLLPDEEDGLPETLEMPPIPIDPTTGELLIPGPEMLAAAQDLPKVKIEGLVEKAEVASSEWVDKGKDEAKRAAADLEGGIT